MASPPLLKWLPNWLSPLRPYLGILLALTTYTTFISMDLAAQYLQIIDPIDSISLLFLRMLFSLVVCYGWLYYTASPDLPFGPRKHRVVLGLRSCLTFCALLGWFFAVRHITMSDATKVYQSRPFVLSFFSKYYLDEPMNTHQFAASAFALVGELLIAKPSLLLSPPASSEVVSSGPESITHSTNFAHYLSYGIIVATVFITVFELVVMRKLKGEVGPVMLLALFSTASVILAAVLLLVTGHPLMFPSSPLGWFVLFLVQIFGILTQVILAAALKIETAVTLALCGQFAIVPAAIGEYLVFGSHFDTLSAVGSAIVTSAGAYAIVKRPPVEDDTEEVGDKLEMAETLLSPEELTGRSESEPSSV